MPGKTRMTRFILCITAALAFFSDAAENEPFHLTPEEQAWLRQIEPVRFTFDAEFTPFEMENEQGEYAGAAADFLKLIIQKLDVEFELVRCDSWIESMEAVRRGEIDLLPCVARNPKREAFLSFSNPYLEFARVVVVRKDYPYTSLEAIPEKHIGVQRASSHHDYIHQKTDLKPILFDSFHEAMLALAGGRIDAVIGNLATVTQTVQNQSLANLKIGGLFGEETFALQIAVRKDLQPLVPLLNRALESIRPEQRNRILDYWVPLPHESGNELQLTRQEQEWLLTHPRVRVGWDPDWAPVEFSGEDGVPRGFSVDLLKQIEEKLGIGFVHEPPRPWPETLEQLKNGKIDMVSCIGPVKGREKFLMYTDEYLRAPVVLFTRPGSPYIRNLRELTGQTLAVPAGYTESEWIATDYPQIIQLNKPTILDGLRAVKEGRAEAFAGSVMQGNYYLSKTKTLGLIINGQTEYENRMMFGVRKDWPVFTRILNKAIASIPEDDNVSFYRKWVWIDYQHGTDYRLAAWIAAAGICIVLIVLFWNGRLSREIQRRTEAERKVEESRAQLEQSYQQLRTLEQHKQNLIHMIVHDMRSPLTGILGVIDLAVLYPETAGKNLEAARFSTQNLIRLVNSLLDVGRLEAGKMPIRKKPGVLSRTAQEALKPLEPIAREHKIDLLLHGEKGECRFDRDLMYRVFDNLISNAIRACTAGDSVRVMIRPAGSRVRVEVRDTGPGIPKEQQSRIFEKFAQAERAKTDAAFPGSGIGLAFCKLAIEAHGGTIGVESLPGRGSTFWFELPAGLSPTALK